MNLRPIKRLIESCFLCSCRAPMNQPHAVLSSCSCPVSLSPLHFRLKVHWCKCRQPSAHGRRRVRRLWRTMPPSLRSCAGAASRAETQRSSPACAGAGPGTRALASRTPTLQRRETTATSSRACPRYTPASGQAHRAPFVALPDISTCKNITYGYMSGLVQVCECRI